MRLPIKSGWPILFFCLVSFLAACGGQYANPNCTRNFTACSEPPAFNCCSQWGDYPEPDKME